MMEAKAVIADHILKIQVTIMLTIVTSPECSMWSQNWFWIHDSGGGVVGLAFYKE